MTRARRRKPGARLSPSDIGARAVLAKFLGYYRPYLLLFSLDLLCATVLAAIDLAFPQFLNFFTKDFFLRPAQEILSALG